MTAPASDIGVLCVDDNTHVAHALRVKFILAGGLAWKGWLHDAASVVEVVRRECPDIVIFDIDMPGRNPFEAMAELMGHCPDVRAIVFSGHVRRDLIDRALDAGAWAYVSKNDGEDLLVQAIRDVADGNFVLSPEVRAVCDRG